MVHREAREPFLASYEHKHNICPESPASQAGCGHPADKGKDQVEPSTLMDRFSYLDVSIEIREFIHIQYDEAIQVERPIVVDAVRGREFADQVETALHVRLRCGVTQREFEGAAHAAFGRIGFTSQAVGEQTRFFVQ